MHPTMPPIFTAPAAPSTRRTAAGVRADRRSPAGLGLDPGEDRRTLATAGTANTQKVPFTQITCIMPRCGRSCSVVVRLLLQRVQVTWRPKNVNVALEMLH